MICIKRTTLQKLRFNLYLLKRYKFLLKTSDNKKAMKDLFSDIEGKQQL